MFSRRRVTLRAPQVEEAGTDGLAEALDLLPTGLQVRRALRRWNRLPTSPFDKPSSAWPHPARLEAEVLGWTLRRLHRYSAFRSSPRDPGWDPL